MWILFQNFILSFWCLFSIFLLILPLTVVQKIPYIYPVSIKPDKTCITESFDKCLQICLTTVDCSTFIQIGKRCELFYYYSDVAFDYFIKDVNSTYCILKSDDKILIELSGQRIYENKNKAMYGKAFQSSINGEHLPEYMNDNQILNCRFRSGFTFAETTAQTNTYSWMSVDMGRVYYVTKIYLFLSFQSDKLIMQQSHGFVGNYPFKSEQGNRCITWYLIENSRSLLTECYSFGRYASVQHAQLYIPLAICELKVYVDV